METLEITSELEAIKLLEDLQSGKTFEQLEIKNIKFENWPVFKIRIQGKDFDSTIPTRIMPPILELQKEIHRLYCISKYGEDNLRRLTKEDKDKLELIVEVGEGSSLYEIQFDEALIKIFSDTVGRMSPEQVTTSILTIALSTASVFAWKAWLKHKEAVKDKETQVDMSKEETKRLGIVSQALSNNNNIQSVAENIDSVRNSLLASLHSEDKITFSSSDEEVSSDLVVPGYVAEELTSSPPEKSKEKIINDDFILLVARFSYEKNRIQVERLSDGIKFWVDIPEEALTAKQYKLIKNSGWIKKKLNMSILVKHRHERIISGTLISAKKVKIRKD